MFGERVHRTRHSAEVAAPAGAVYALLADAERRPLYCPPVLHVERLDFDGPRERLRSWESAAGDIRSSISARVRHPHERRIEFVQLRHEAPVESMAGEWTVEETAGGRSVVTVRHEFTVVGDHPDDVAWVGLVTDDNARAELESLRRVAESGIGLDDLVLSFEESVRVDGPGELVYDFLYRAADWPGLVPHVPRLELAESSPGLQVLDYDVRLPDGAVRTGGSVRLCFPHAGRIVHKQTTPAVPAAAAHIGEWSVLPDEHGVRVVAQHSVLLDENAVGDLPSGVGQARLGLREDIGRISLDTLELAKRHAESAVRALPRRPALTGEPI
ncbi:aromatase/cyclase [Streptomyces sp. WM6378]|uniref:aromatase/cyclase n=1 Tax=Streptomyces sp. WM6378 TaxID=1415557 RepID=UPI0006AEB58F|nr:SRPBCC family protein [Streptomyces sp. WM6378]KOU40406.1 cyclase [Streptomyces sp. WM6378]